MFSEKIWGFKQGEAKVGKGVLGIAFGCVIAVLAVAGVVLGKGSKDPLGWAWIDVVSQSPFREKSHLLRLSLLLNTKMTFRFTPLATASY